MSNDLLNPNADEWERKQLFEDGGRNQHPWYQSRSECVLSIIKKIKPQNLADIGSSDMFLTKKVKDFVAENIYAVDLIFPENGVTSDDGIKCLRYIKDLPDSEIDCISMLDVLEHIEDDVSFYKEAVAKLKSGGTILVTVPAFQFLFSAHDERARHIRRYNRKQLLQLLKQDDIEVQYCHYFYTSLFKMRLLSSLRKKNYSGDSNNWKYSEKHLITIFFKSLLDFDFWLNKTFNKIGIRFPGLSLIAVCRKK